jgi:ATP-dependent exoDNAse (exonuclease V) beta subunit
MANSILKKDIEINFPHFTVLKASAGSGKTYTLTERFVQFILSTKIPQNHLRHILAITFSNNAAKEMKERVLHWLKSIYFEDPEAITELSKIVSLDKTSMGERAGQVIEEILSNYSDFQVRTIDSFMTTIFKASAIDFGYNPEFEILMDSSPLIEYAFNLFLRNVKEGSSEAELLHEIIRIILEHRPEDSPYLWDPSAPLLNEIKKIYRKLASSGEKPKIEDYSAEETKVKNKIIASIESLENLIAESGLERSGGSSYPKILSAVRDGKFADLIGKGLKANPVKKPKKADGSIQRAYESICNEWDEVGKLINHYISCYARSHLIPYLKLYEKFSNSVERVKKQQGKIFIEDINKKLGEYLSANIVPDIYFRLGEVIFHFLIDEFQDTSPIQWRNLLPLVENSLSQGGSLFVVGDTKQAIYGFRDADYTIMRSSEFQNPFPSASHNVLELDTNYRSLPKILEFNEKVFKNIAASSEKYKGPVQRSGLDDYTQKPKRDENSGYVEIELFEKNEESPPEKQKIQELVEELARRGYRYRDVAILTAKNEDVVKITTWLNEKNIPFISYSSLDIRRRKITGEIISLLSFLDSPPDDLSFATFILGEIFERTLKKFHRSIKEERIHQFLFNNRNHNPLYKAFQNEFHDLWERYFSELFRSSGYLPLYDLVTEIFNVFKLFELMEEEEATLAKILEAIKNFEGTGYNNLRDFLKFATDEGTTEQEWNIDVPKNVDSVRVMTVHKAKGLGFSVVIALLYGERSRGFDYIIHREGGEVCLLKINKNIACCDPLFEKLYDEEALNEMVNRLNSLYVEFTRAKEELYVIGVKRRQDGFPFDLLPSENYPPSLKPDKLTDITPEPEEPLPLFHCSNPIYFPESAEKEIAPEERRRGDFIHKILSYIYDTGERFEEILNQAFKRVSEEMRVEYDMNEIKDVVMGILENKEMAEYFKEKPGREIKNEQEVSDSEGRLFRLDRLIIDENRVTIIDYKTGKDRSAEEEYETQMKNYMKILREIHPERTIEGFIAYMDLKEVRKVT